MSDCINLAVKSFAPRAWSQLTLHACFVKLTMFIKNILVQAHKAEKTYAQIKDQREREREREREIRLTYILMIKKSCHDSQTLPLRPWGIHSPSWHGAVSPSAHRKIFGAFYAVTSNHLMLCLASVPPCQVVLVVDSMVAETEGRREGR